MNLILKTHRGFGLIELIMVIFVLGAAFLMTLKGTALIAPLRAYAVAQQISHYQSGVMQYQADMLALPGDDILGPKRWKRAEALYNFGGAPVSFAGNTKIDGFLDDSGNAQGEQYVAWQDLRLAGYVDGDPTLVGQSARPENTFGGTFGFAADNFGLQQVLCISQVPGRDAALIDKRLDDGVVSTGRMRGTSQWDPVEAKNHFSAPDSTPYNPEKTYIICLPYLP
jgi:prepilin-type N-terminal cleavage/methylation domain-containing protein